MATTSTTTRSGRPTRWVRRLAPVATLVGLVAAVRSWRLRAATRAFHERHGPPPSD